MATQSLSRTQSIVTTGGSFNTGGAAAATFKVSDYSDQGLGTAEDLNRFLTQLNPLTQQIQALSAGVNINGFDGGIYSLNVPLFQSDWIAITLNTGATLNANTLVTFAGVAAGNAYRKDTVGNVNLLYNVSAANANMYTLPQPYWPPCTITQGVLTITGAGVVTSSASGQGIVTWPAANVSAGQFPIFPLYLKVASGRTPAAVFIMGLKPTTNQTLASLASGSISGPVACSWSWLSNTAPLDTASSGQKVNTVRINGMSGLTYNQAYIATVLVLYGQTGQSSGA